MADEFQQRRSYGQFCALARSLDRIGNRWSLLILRELFTGPASFAGLRRNLPGIASNLLVQRLSELERDRIIQRSEHPPRSKAVRYQLTEVGAALEPAVLDLIRWGASWMYSGAGPDFQSAEWLPLALRALLESRSIRNPVGAVLVESGTQQVAISIGRNGRRVTTGVPRLPRAVVRGPYAAILALVAGGGRPAADISLSGDSEFARAALRSGHRQRTAGDPIPNLTIRS